MAEPAKKLEVKSETRPVAPTPLQAWHPFENFRQEIGRLFEEFDRGFWPSRLGRSVLGLEPFRRLEASIGNMPAVDIVETQKGFEVKAELPGMSEKDIEVKLANGGLTIKGEKQEEKEEKEKDYYIRERRFGSFERSFSLPDGVDREKIEANFKNGVLTVTLPKTAEALKEAKTIEVKAA